MGYQGWDKILMVTLISSKKLGGYKIVRHTVYEEEEDENFMSILKMNDHMCSFIIKLLIYVFPTLGIVRTESKETNKPKIHEFFKHHEDKEHKFIIFA